jgi:TolB-like protein/Tfp pilus assembly protein PilF
MVTDDGRIKIMDFGLAIVAGDTRVTRTGMVVGTADYMSPEQVRGENVDARTDIWSFGVVLYELLTGRRPFRGDYEQAVMYAIANEDAPSPLTLAPDLPGGVAALITKMLARNRDDRVAGVAAVIEALESLKEPVVRNESDARNRRKSDVKTALPGVAVLPLASIRPDPETDFLGFALADQIIGALAYVDSISVRPSSAVRKYQGQSVDVPAAGRELHADFVLAGHYLREANTVRLNVELIAIEGSELVWRESIEVKYENAFKLQDMVSKKVLRGLKVQFPKNAKVSQPDEPSNPLAYEYYLRGVAYPTTLGDNRLAIEMVEKSIKLDPDFAPAHAELGYRHAQAGNYGMAGKSGYQKAESAYLRALSLNENQLNALYHLTLLYIEFGRHEEAIDLIKRLLRVAPNGAWVRFTLSYLCRYTGMLERSMQEVEKALELDPRNPRFRSAGFVYMYAADYERAYELFKKLDEKSAPPVAWQGWALSLMGERERAIECFDRATAMEPDGFASICFGSIRSFLIGDREDGVRRTDRLEKELEQRGVADAETMYLLASSSALLAEKEKSVRWLRKGVEAGFFNYPAMLRNPFLDSVRDDPAFEQVLAIAKEKHEQFKLVFSARMP